MGLLGAANYAIAAQNVLPLHQQHGAGNSAGRLVGFLQILDRPGVLAPNPYRRPDERRLGVRFGLFLDHGQRAAGERFAQNPPHPGLSVAHRPVPEGRDGSGVESLAHLRRQMVRGRFQAIQQLDQNRVRNRGGRFAVGQILAAYNHPAGP